MRVISLLIISFLLISSGCRLFDKTVPYAPPDTPYVQSEITSPGVGDVISRGSTMSIVWNGIKSKNITLELWKKKQYNHQTIVSGIENRGSYKWVVPVETPGSVSYQIKLMDAVNQSDYIYSEVFTIK